MSTPGFRSEAASLAHPTGFRVISAAVAVFLSCWAAGATAQSLSELYQAARNYDAAYQSALQQAEANRYKVEQAKAARLLSLGLKASIARQHFDSSTDTNVDASSAGPGSGAVNSAQAALQSNNFSVTNKNIALQARQSLSLIHI